jgi:hypothetical protein
VSNAERIIFEQKGDFQALYAAQDWCKANGISYGSSQRGSPTGLMRGDVCISKWQNMTKAEQKDLDGTMTGDMRNGPVVIEMKARQS